MVKITGRKLRYKRMKIKCGQLSKNFLIFFPGADNEK